MSTDRYTLYGREFVVTAYFTGPDHEAEANTHMLTHSDLHVLVRVADATVLASLKDNGRWQSKAERTATAEAMGFATCTEFEEVTAQWPARMRAAAAGRAMTPPYVEPGWVDMILDR